MAITNGYATLDEIKAEMSITDATDDVRLERAVEAASRWIDAHCGTRFYSTDADETRYYTHDAFDATRFDCPDDIISITELATDNDGDGVHETVWTSSDYVLEPFNAALIGEPYRAVLATPAGAHVFPPTKRGVKISGRFGWCATGEHPADVTRACLLLAQRLFLRKDSPLGVMGTSAVGTIMMKIPTDADVEQLLARFRRTRMVF